MNVKKEIETIQKQMAEPDFWKAKAKAQKLTEKYQKLKKQLELEKEKPDFFKGEYDVNNAVLTISAGTGGTEAADWAEMLLKMYLRFAGRKGFKAEIISISSAQEAGIKSAAVEISGPFAFGWLKSEAGIHRLVRISPFDADKARHTSFALVEVVPEISESKGKELEIPSKDLRIDVFRASGHGGQSVNTTDSAVRITHIPTGIVVSCQNERSQHQNKAEAERVLKSKLTQLMLQQKAEKLSQIKVKHKGPGWGAQVRSYVLDPYKLVKDHRTGFKSKNVESVLEGDLKSFIEKNLKIK